MPPETNLLYALILACEMGFWVVLLVALAVRYLLAKKRLSRALLLSLPLVDVMLLVFTAMDLRRGSTATFAHGLAAAYVGFTIAFGGMAVKWADAHFAHRFAAGPVPEKAPSRRWNVVRYDFNLWARCIVAASSPWPWSKRSCNLSVMVKQLKLCWHGTSMRSAPSCSGSSLVLRGVWQQHGAVRTDA